MRSFFQMLARVRSLLTRKDYEADLEDELRFHTENEVAERVKRGVPEPEARRQVALEFGNVTQVKEDCRQSRWTHAAETFAQDLRFGARMLMRARSFTAVAVLVLALGIGANTAIFSVVKGVLLDPLALPEPERLVAIWQQKRDGSTSGHFSPTNFLDVQREVKGLSAVAAYTDGTLTLTGQGDAVNLPVMYATPTLLDVLQIRPAMGRFYHLEEAEPKAARVVVLGDRLWRGRFGSDRTIVGRSIMLAGEPHEVLGVLPPEVALPGESFDAIVPLSFGPKVDTQRGAQFLEVLGRLAPGVSPEQATAQLRALFARLEQEFPRSNLETSAIAIPYQDDIVGTVRRPLWVLMLAVAVLALIASANIANLLLARNAARERELAMRRALGAQRGRLVRQLLTESLLLSFLAAVVAVGLAYGGVGILKAAAPPDMPRVEELQLDATVLAFTGGLALLTAILFGFAPALRAAATNIYGAAKATGGAIAGSRHGGRLRTTLVAGELALALVLLIGAGLLLRSLAKAQGVHQGFDPTNVITFSVSLPEKSYPDTASVARFHQQLTERLQALPGVKDAGSVYPLPLSKQYFFSSLTIVGAPAPPPGEEPVAALTAASPDYFTAMKIPIVRGRGFTPADTTGAARVLLVSESAARRLWPNEEPIGKRVEFGAQGGYEKVAGEVVGVVGDVRYLGPEKNAFRMFYAPIDQAGLLEARFVVRSELKPELLVARVAEEVRALDRDVPVDIVRTMEQLLGQSLARRKFYLSLMAAFAVVALLIAASGLYGVISFGVAQRTNEIGIRMALGATARRVVGMVLREALAVVSIATAIGLAASVALGKSIRALLFQTETTDPVTLGAVAASLALVALVAAYLPARRAAAVQPMNALRAE